MPTVAPSNKSTFNIRRKYADFICIYVYNSPLPSSSEFFIGRLAKYKAVQIQNTLSTSSVSLASFLLHKISIDIILNFLKAVPAAFIFTLLILIFIFVNSLLNYKYKHSPNSHVNPSLLWKVRHITKFMSMKKRNGGNAQPCLTTLSIRFF